MTLHTPAIQDQSMPQPRNGVIFLPCLWRGQQDDLRLYVERMPSSDPARSRLVLEPYNIPDALFGAYNTAESLPARWRLMMGVDIPIRYPEEQDLYTYPSAMLQITAPNNVIISPRPDLERLPLAEFPWADKLFVPEELERIATEQLASRWADYCLAHNIGADTPKADIQLAYWDMLKADINASCTGVVNLRTLLTGDQPANYSTDVAM